MTFRLQPRALNSAAGWGIRSKTDPCFVAGVEGSPSTASKTKMATRCCLFLGLAT